MDDSQWMPPDPNRGVPSPDPVADTPPPSLPELPGLPTASSNVPPPPPWAGELPTVDPVAPVEPSRPRKSKVLVAGGVLAVLAVGAGGVFAVQQYSGSSSGGAASPSELGTDLMTAIEQEDVLGMVDTLLPGERDVMRQPLIDLVSELTRLDVLSDDADLTSIAGLDVVLEGESTNVRGTNVDDIVNVDMYADATVTVDGAFVPVGELITDNLDGEMVDELRGSKTTEREPFEIWLTAVEHDDRWYFSLFHSAAELARADIEPSPEIPLEGIGVSGADTPEAAFDELLARATQLDVAGMIQILNPGEAAALQRYAPLFLPEAEAAIAELPPFEVSIDSRDIRVEGEGDARTVFVDGLALSGSFGEPGDQITFSATFDQECFTASAEGDWIDPQQIEQCVGDVAGTEQLDEMLSEAPAVAEFFTALQEAFADVEPVGLELRQVDGAWFVSPVSTWAEALLAVLGALDRQELDRLIELGTAGAEEFFDLALGGMLGGDDGFDDSFDDGFDVSFDDSFDDSFDGFDDSTSDDFGDDLSEQASDAWDRCYDEPDAATAGECFQSYVDSGEIDASYVPIELRFPECGEYGELAWSRELYSMDDAAFTAAAAAAQPCFAALVESGEVAEWELGNELTKLECFEGRNWYNTFDDPEYDKRFEACVWGETSATTAPPASVAPVTTVAG